MTQLEDRQKPFILSIKRFFRSTYFLYLKGRRTIEYILNNLDSNIKSEREGVTLVDRLDYTRGDYNTRYVYHSSPPQVWQNAWLITEKILLEFKKDVERDGARLVIIAFPTSDEYFENEVSLLSDHQEGEDKMPQEFDLLYPFERLQQFSYSNDIYFLSLYTGLRDYVKANTYLEKPYFTFKCDGHWSFRASYRCRVGG